MAEAGKVYGPVAAKILNGTDEGLISLELQDGTVYQGYSFGAKKSVAGELVFQTVRISTTSYFIPLYFTEPWEILLSRMSQGSWIIDMHCTF
jgi:hypothetical protein